MKKRNNLEFLNKLTVLLRKKLSPINTTNFIDKLFKDYLNIEEIRYIIWDNNNMALKDFAHETVLEENLKENQLINFLYANFSIKKGKTFYFNEQEYNCEFEEKEINSIQADINKINTIHYPIIANGEVFGLIRIKIKENTFDKEFFYILKISSMLISGSIINYLLI